MTDELPPGRRVHPQSAPGDFCSDISCCISCDLPRVVAPTLFAVRDEGPNDPHRFA